MNAMDIDDEGLDTTDRRLLAAIVQKFASGPVGGAAVAAVIGEEVETIEDVYEPYLLQLGFLDRTPQGRIATESAREHLRGAGLRGAAARASADRLDTGLWDGVTAEGRTESESHRVTTRASSGVPRRYGDLAVATRGLVKSYGRHKALVGLDMSVPRGRVYGFLGPNGSGKTTALRLLTGLLRPERRHDHPVRHAIHVARPDAPVPGRLADRDAVVLSVPVGLREPARAVRVGPATDRSSHRPGARVRRHGRPLQGCRADLFAGHEAAPRHRRGDALGSGPAAARRAGQRPRPGRHRGHARDAALLH